MLNLPDPNIAPAARMPIATVPDALLHVYDGVPDDQEWVGEALRQARVCSVPAVATALNLLAHEPLGAPLGPDQERSVRVSRVTGLAVAPGQNDEPRMLGVAMAHGCCYVMWEENVEGPLLAVDFQWPTAFGWGAGKDSLAQEQLKVRCLRQYELQAVSMLENLADAHLAKGITVNFEGDWDESTVLFRKRLSQAVVNRWAQLLTAAYEEAQEAASLQAPGSVMVQMPMAA